VAISKRKRLRRAVRSPLILAAVRVFSVLPLRAALWLGSLAAAVAWRVASSPRRRALAHLAAAFPEKTQAEREELARGMFRHLAWVVMELVAVKSWEGRLESYVDFSPPTLLHEVLARGRGVVFVTGHVGNWEVMARKVAHAGIPNATIAKRAKDAALTRLIESFRREGGVTTLWREDESTGRNIIRTLRGGKALGILIDQDTRVQGVFVPFFGRPAFTPRAAADLALRFRAPVVVVTTHRRGANPLDGHRIEVVEIPYDPDPADREVEVVRLTAACSAALEDAIRRHPTEWVWMHERWKTVPAGDVAVAKPMPKTAGLSGR
jgi:KDO2-lipid IV(A) lauroyltransferase